MIAAWIEELTRPTLREPDVDADEEKMLRRSLALRIFEKSLPSLYRSARLDSPLLTQRVNLSIPGEVPKTKSVVFMGPPGIGKTTLAVAMLRAMLQRELMTASLSNDDDVAGVVRRFRFAHAHRLGVARICGPDGPAELSAALRSDTLLVDDLGQEAAVASNPIGALLQERHADERVTWITTGLTAAEIANRYGLGIARRVFEHATLVRDGRG